MSFSSFATTGLPTFCSNAATTWAAYNRWPNRFSLYDDGSVVTGRRRITRQVSFGIVRREMPTDLRQPAVSRLGEYLCFRVPLAYWLEQHGYDVTYCSNSDMLSPERGQQCKTFLSVGHDGCGTSDRPSVKLLIESGMNALFLSGNSICWVSPFLAAADGRPNRIIYRAGPYGGAAKQRQGA